MAAGCYASFRRMASLTNQAGDAVAADAAPVLSQGRGTRDGAYRIKVSETNDSDEPIEEMEELQKLPGFGVH